MTTSTVSSVHDEAVAIVREAVNEYLPIARVRRIDLDTKTWEDLMDEIREVVARTN
jgi:hypothetical protein